MNTHTHKNKQTDRQAETTNRITHSLVHSFKKNFSVQINWERKCYRFIEALKVYLKKKKKPKINEQKLFSCFFFQTLKNVLNSFWVFYSSVQYFNRLELLSQTKLLHSQYFSFTNVLHMNVFVKVQPDHVISIKLFAHSFVWQFNNNKNKKKKKNYFYQFSPPKKSFK